MGAIARWKTKGGTREWSVRVVWWSFIVGGGFRYSVNDLVIVIGPVHVLCLGRVGPVTKSERILLWMGSRTSVYAAIVPTFIALGYAHKTGQWGDLWFGPWTVYRKDTLYDATIAKTALLRWPRAR